MDFAGGSARAAGSSGNASRAFVDGGRSCGRRRRSWQQKKAGEQVDNSGSPCAVSAAAEIEGMLDSRQNRQHVVAAKPRCWAAFVRPGASRAPRNKVAGPGTEEVDADEVVFGRANPAKLESSNARPRRQRFTKLAEQTSAPFISRRGTKDRVSITWRPLSPVGPAWPTKSPLPHKSQARRFSWFSAPCTARSVADMAYGP